MKQEHNINDYVYYDETSPTLMRWKERDHLKKFAKTFNSRFPHKPAGKNAVKSATRTQYATVRIGGVAKASHRVIYELVVGKIPENKWVDHIDGDFTNNHPSNLRLASPTQNQANQRSRKTKKSGLMKGVSKARRKFFARIASNKKTIHLGMFHTEIEAHQAYLKAAQEKWGEYHCAG